MAVRLMSKKDLIVWKFAMLAIRVAWTDICTGKSFLDKYGYIEIPLETINADIQTVVDLGLINSYSAHSARFTKIFMVGDGKPRCVRCVMTGNFPFLGV